MGRRVSDDFSLRVPGKSWQKSGQDQIKKLTGELEDICKLCARAKQVTLLPQLMADMLFNEEEQRSAAPAVDHEKEKLKAAVELLGQTSRDKPNIFLA